MAKSLAHKFVSAISDGADATLVRPSNWNADHNFYLGYRTVTTTSDTIVDTDNWSLITYNSASAVAVTIAIPSGGNMASGWNTTLKNIGAGAVTVTVTSGTVNGAGTLVLNQNDSAIWYSQGTSAYWAVVIPAPVAAVGSLRYDTTQALTTAQQGIALKNIGESVYLINGKLVESHAANAATFTVQTLGSATPSATDPVGVSFQDGSTLWITAALSITIPSGQALGGGNSIPFRLWFAIANNAGTPVLVVRNCVSQTTIITNNISGFDGRGILSAVTPVASSKQTNYSSANITNVLYQLIAFADYESGLTTSTAWTVSPTRIALVGPSTPLPGTPIQFKNFSTTTQFSTGSSALVATGVQVSITPYSVLDPMHVKVNYDVAAGFNTGAYAQTQLLRGGVTSVSSNFSNAYSQGLVVQACVAEIDVYDWPQSTSSQTYQLYCLASGGAATTYCPFSAGYIEARELMG